MYYRALLALTVVIATQFGGSGSLFAEGISRTDAVRVARKCTDGGEVLDSGQARNGGFAFRVLVGSQVRTIYVDSSGRCA